jgi:DNA-binding FrmR family transcriptional regulator
MTHYDEPSAQTVSAIDHCRVEFAQTRGVTRGAIDQLFAGNTHDPYPPFRAHFKDVCATPQANPDAYLNDMMGIKQMFRPSSCQSVCEASLKNMATAHDLIETSSQALADGLIDRKECLEILNRLQANYDALDALKQAVLDKKNELSGAQIKGLVGKR